MPTQSNFSGRSGAYDWGAFFEGLRQGHASAYFVLIALAAAATVAFWAGTNIRKKDNRR